METAGNILLHLGLVVTVYAVVMSILGARTRRPALVESSRNAVWAAGLIVATCAGLLIACFLTGKFQVEYVYSYSNSTMPGFYKVAALWGGQAGSLLFWVLVLFVYSSAVMWVQRNRSHQLLPYVIATLMTIATFFLVILVFTTNPFNTLPFTPADGRGLNPLLQNYYMVIHPPSLYLGYVGMTVPFAFAMAALMTGRLDNQWILQIRRWTLLAWFFLSMGNLLGASWAYEVLGWGGYWAWDPVENAAFMPWLTATAFLHSVIIQEKRNMLKTWNMVLVILSFLFTMTGTFLTRSGIVSSVHSFAQSGIGSYFLGFLVFAITVSGSLVIYRLKDLQSKNTLDSFLSRESSFLFNNLVLVGGAFAILWGTLFPVLSEWIRGTKITVGPPFFNSVMVPIGLLLLLLTGIGPIVAWRKTTPEQLKQNFLLPVAIAIVASVVTIVFTRQIYVVASLSFCAFVLASIVGEYRKGIAVRCRTLNEDFVTALLRLVATNRRRYGGYIVHVAIVMLFVGFTGSAFKVEEEMQFKVGETKNIGRYSVRYDSLSDQQDAHKDTVYANVSVFKNGAPFTDMHPARVFYKSHVGGEPAQPNTQVSIQRSLREDLYMALLTYDPNNQSAFLKVIVHPLVQWIWLGGLCLIFGTFIVMWPAGSQIAVKQIARAAALALVIFGAAVTASVPAAMAQGATEESISKQLKCLCGCGFPDLASCSCDEWAQPAKAEIRARLARGEDEATILKYFVSRDGEKVLTSPVPQGFNRTAWIVPAAALAAGLLAVSVIIRKWRKEPSVQDEPSPRPQVSDEKYRKELDRELYGTEEQT
ncbi:MAG TPA: cytochrome c-type biogenesis CcmF C-terminal domain-containing protein [Bdellovibrionota bacterium]|nr:cytochrome c-type biogenesis CcmF C-terminal domain-containing protein [Bdellovibrionota bacterium]